MGVDGFYSLINKKKYPQQTISIEVKCQISTCGINIFPLLWSVRCQPRLKFFKLLTDFDVNTRHTFSYFR